MSASTSSRTPENLGPAARPGPSGWAGLFWEAFKRSRNAMALLDDRRHHVEVNGAYIQLGGYRRDELIRLPVYDFIADGPVMSALEWRATLEQPQFTGVVDVVRADGTRVTVEFAGHPEVLTGRQLVLVVVTSVSRRRRRPDEAGAVPASAATLTARELDVVELIAVGLSGSEIAQELHLAHNTVRTHVRNAMRKTAARSRAQLVAKALGEGIVLGRDR